MSVICDTCGGPTTYEKAPGHCDYCWEVETRLKEYLRRGGANASAFVMGALGEAKLGVPCTAVGGLILPGWTCAACGCFNGSGKTELESCRGCGVIR